jgi:hypothetical protein
VDGKTEPHEFDAQDKAQAFVDEKLAPLNGNWFKQPDNSDLPFYDFYIDLVQRIYLLHTSWITRPSIYDITDLEISARDPDTVSVESLRRGDMIGRWVNASISPTVVVPEHITIPMPDIIPNSVQTDVINAIREQIKSQLAQDSGAWVIMSAVPSMTLINAEDVLMCYVASIQPDKRYKVYCDWGDTSDIERCARQGRKCRSEALARQLFPMLNEFEFMVN